MKYNLCYLSYNNYFNRRIKRLDTLADYTDNFNYYLQPEVSNISWKDGVNIEVVHNYDIAANNPGWDYVLFINPTTSQIESRWFILEEEQQCKGQWVFKLRRDLIADFWEDFTSAAVYVEKGKLTTQLENISDINPLIYNREDFKANQKKISEIELRDKSRCKWLVGYLNKNAVIADDGNAQGEKSYTTYLNKAAQPDLILGSLNNAYFNKFINRSLAAPQSTYFTTSVRANANSLSNVYYQYTITKNRVSLRTIPASEHEGNIICTTMSPNVSTPSITAWMDIDIYTNTFFAWSNSQQANIGCTMAEYLDAVALKDKIIYVGDTNKFYKVKLVQGSATTINQRVDPTRDAIWYNALTPCMGNCIITSPSINNFKATVEFTPSAKIVLEEIFNEGYYTTLNPAKMNKTVDEAYDAFAIPVLEDNYFFYAVGEGGNVDINFASTDYNSAFAMAQEILNTSSAAIDLQLLPFCPLPTDWVYEIPPGANGAGKIQFKIPDNTNKVNWSLITDLNGGPRNVLFHLNRTQFSTVIPFVDPTDYSTPEKIKECNQLDMWRLSSGDYSSSFEFNPARNGSVAYFEVDCKYKPYQPYIHVAPNFGGLYGADFNDTRGLVCTGTNYSVSRLTDAWETYERNNINYQNAFNRTIEHLDATRDVGRIQDIATVVAGAGAGAASGAMIGSMVPVIGTAAGAIVGGVMSAGAGIADVVLNESLYKENKSYKIDQFNLSLENIQALPNTLVATGAQNPNNKVYPVLELYSCTPIEREAYRLKLKYNGWSINVCTEHIEDYIDLSSDTYIKGQIIKIDIAGAAHEVSELATEVAKGFIVERRT